MPTADNGTAMVERDSCMPSIRWSPWLIRHAAVDSGLMGKSEMHAVPSTRYRRVASARVVSSSIGASVEAARIASIGRT